MRTSHPPRYSFLSLVGLALSVMHLGSCNDEPGLYIVAWNRPLAYIIVGQTETQSVILSKPVSETTFIDIENRYLDIVSLDPPDTLTFQGGESKKDIQMKGLKASNGEISIRFTLRNAKEFRDLTLQVKNAD